MRTNSIIEQIHHEASTSEQLLLIEADRIIEKASDEKTTSKIKQLQSLGFSNFKEAVELSPEQVSKIKRLKSLISEYRIKAPTAKFMTDEAVVELCKKYGLVQAPVSTYIDRIPEKNMDEILNFKIDKSYLRSSFMDTVEVGEFSFSKNEKNYKVNFAKAISQDSIKQILGKKAMDAIEFILSNWEDATIVEAYGTRRRIGILSQEKGDYTQVFQKYSNIIMSALKVAIKHKAIELNQLSPSIANLETNNPSIFDLIANHSLLYDAAGRILKSSQSGEMELRIIAPKHMLELSDYEINDCCQAIPKGYEFVSPKVQQWFEQDDPIVQVKVDGGWLNLTAWGNEAELPESFNESLN